ncbi:MAG TPA: hypothetical protein VMM76_22240 [Pirellulaceae bacterium]|nr:hypothetical protein [Pirellulaceae bacterium]
MTRKSTLLAATFVCVASLMTCAYVLAQPGDELRVPQEPDAAFEPLLRGPVHEAFAEQYSENRKPDLVVPKQPPALVDELPPEVKPEGEHVDWIPGYWGWDDEREDFIWISGVWRKTPPQQRWLPGYWTEHEKGWSWVSGTWVNQAVEELHYLPEPPATLELGAVGEAPSEQHFWIPGTWRYQVDRYSWRPGYWSRGYTDWVWVPARYIWTPRGCIYAGGYWDYPLPVRGYLYAPAYFHQPVYLTAGYRYTPSVYIAANLLLDHFWVRPGYCHYYFGDYYGPRYSAWGFSPWFRYTSLSRISYDPLYSYYGHRFHGSWQSQRTQWSRNYDWYVAHENWRPAHRWRDQTVIQNNVVNIDVRNYTNIDVRNINNSLLGRSHHDSGNRRDGDLRTVHIDQQQRERSREQFSGIRDLAEDRRRTELDRPNGIAARSEGNRRDLIQDAERGTRGSFRLPDAAVSRRPGSDRGRDARGTGLSQQVEQILGRGGSTSNGSSRSDRQSAVGRTSFDDEPRRGDRERGDRAGLDQGRGTLTTPRENPDRPNLERPATTPSIPPAVRDSATRPEGRIEQRPGSDPASAERNESWRDRIRQRGEDARNALPRTRGGASESRPQLRDEGASGQPLPATRESQPRVDVPNTTNRAATQAQEALRSLQERARPSSSVPGRSLIDELRNSQNRGAAPRPTDQPALRPDRGPSALQGQRPSVQSQTSPRIGVPERRPSIVQPQPQRQIQPQPQRQIQPRANAQPRAAAPNTRPATPNFLGQPRTTTQPRSSARPNNPSAGRSAPSVRPAESESRRPPAGASNRGGASPRSGLGRTREGGR